MKKAVLLVIAIAVFASSCAMTSMVTIETTPDKAEVIVDGRPVGESPVTIEMSNALWDDEDILIQKKGYRDLRTEADKEIKIKNLIIGIFVWPALLWVYGPEENQAFTLSEE